MFSVIKGFQHIKTNSKCNYLFSKANEVFSVFKMGVTCYMQSHKLINRAYNHPSISSQCRRTIVYYFTNYM